ncbi:MAG: hypothetical protein GY795_10670 [Desulfobacterales bacterium]|nr:hypothetical protein [Desulfobacterales bacterium]
MTNDPNKKNIILTMAGTVEKFVDISPKRIVMKGSEGQVIKETLTIVPEKKYPFKIVGTRAKTGKNITYKLDEVKKADKTEYMLTVENLKKDKGSYHDTIFLKTDSKVRPEIDIPVRCYIKAVKKEKVEKPKE